MTPIRILLVENCPSDALRLQRMLDSSDVHVTVASTVELAMETLRGAVDVVLLSLPLRDLADATAIEHLGHRTKCPPIVVLTDRPESRGHSRRHEVVHDTLAKAHIDQHTLRQSMRYAIERQATHAKLRHMATIDAMTGLPNRRLIQQSLIEATERSLRTGSNLALLTLDLDDFKDINDSLGHTAGDALLRLASERLGCHVRGTDMLGRLGGDEFALILEDLADAHAAASVADKLITALTAPYVLGGVEVTTGVSIGIATTDTANDADALMRQADLAMYSAKQGGGRTWRFFEAQLQVEVDRRMRRQAELRHALQNQDFSLHYQPIVSLRTGLPVAYEALARWSRADGIALGGSFIPDIETSSLAVPFGCWVIQEACRQLAAQAAAGSAARITVNVCARQVLPGPRERTLVQAITEALETTGAPPEQLVVEVTEGMFMGDLDRTSSILQELRSLGVKVAIDDFGSGYCSLQYLARLPVDTLKIDGSFIKRSAAPRSRALLQAIVRLGASVGMEVIGEWVETAAQAEMLRAMGCDLSQGWHHAAALPAHEVDWASSPRRRDAGKLRLLS